MAMSRSGACTIYLALHANRITESLENHEEDRYLELTMNNLCIEARYIAWIGAHSKIHIMGRTNTK